MIKKGILILSFTLVFECSSMTAEEAVLRCKTSIEKTEEISKQIKNSNLKQIAQIALSLMQKNLEKLSKSTLQNIPSITQQCIRQGEHILWLKEDVDSEMKEATPTSVNEPVIAEKKSAKKNKTKDFPANSKILKKILKKKDKEANNSSL